MLHLISDGDGAFRLTRGGRTVGWVRGASIRVGAFTTELEALRASLRGERALDDYVGGGGLLRARREWQADAGDVQETGRARVVVDSPPRDEEREGRPPPTRTLALEAPDGGRASGDTLGDVHLVHDGAYEWIVRGERPVARLIRPERHGAASEATSEPSAGAFALEFVAPSVVPSILRVTLARVLVRAMDATPPDRSTPAGPGDGGAPYIPAVVTGSRSGSRSDHEKPPPRPPA